MANSVNIRSVIGLPPDDTVRAFDARGDLRTTVKWSEMYHDDHARAFTVAKVARLDLLETIRKSIDDVARNGGTFEQWQAKLVPELQKAGWWGRVEDKELTGTSQPIFVGPRRLRTIYETNMRVSRAAGRWARIQEMKDVAPYLMYSAVNDRHTRPLHRLWGGLDTGIRTILPVDHPWWDTHYPPCGWGCRCDVIQLSDRDLRARGLSVSKEPPPEGPGTRFWRAGAEKPVMVPAGIDPGWDYNPGKASMRAIGEKAAVTLGQAAARDLPGARAVLRDLVDSPAFMKALDEPGNSFPVMVLADDVRGRIGARSPVAVLSSDTVSKQRRNHPEIGIDQYRQLPEMGASPELIFQQDDQRLIFMRTVDGRWLKAVAKVTDDRGELFVVSLQWARAKELQRVRQRNTLIFGQIAGAIAALIAGEIEPAEEGA